MGPPGYLDDTQVGVVGIALDLALCVVNGGSSGDAGERRDSTLRWLLEGADSWALEMLELWIRTSGKEL